MTLLLDRPLAVDGDVPSGDVSRLSDDGLLAELASVTAIRRRAEARAAVLADEIARRSAVALGYSGLAQRTGARTPQRLIQQVTGSSGREAAVLIRAGEALATTDPVVAPAIDAPTWLAPVARLVLEGAISLEALDAVRMGLGQPDETVTGERLRAAVDGLIPMLTSLTVEQIAARARGLRNDLDLDAVQVRELERRERRSLRWARQADGSTKLWAVLDPESAAIVTGALDAVTAPRRGGPRFVDPEQARRADEVLDDPRTTEQLALDALVEMVATAVKADRGAVFGTRRPEVRVLVTAAELRRGTGIAVIEGQTEGFSIATAERHICESGVLPIVFADSGQPLQLGRTQRTHSRAQRIAIAARDGGCRFGDCERPPSWAEVHHVQPWARGGGTDIDNSILLCRHHHMLVHDNGWRITGTSDGAVAIPPPGMNRAPVPLTTKGIVAARLFASKDG